MGETVGSFKFFSLDDIDNQENTLFDAHGNNLVQLIKTAYQLEHYTADISFMGIEPESLEVGQQLSPIIESKIDQYAFAALHFQV
jgi:hydrogenase maturation protease